MDSLKYQTFSVVGHDRGGRVAHRLCRDFPNRTDKMVVLDICPTLDMYKATNSEFAFGYFHWFLKGLSRTQATRCILACSPPLKKL